MTSVPARPCPAASRGLTHARLAGGRGHGAPFLSCRPVCRPLPSRLGRLAEGVLTALTLPNGPNEVVGRGGCLAWHLAQQCRTPLPAHRSARGALSGLMRNAQP